MVDEKIVTLTYEEACQKSFLEGGAIECIAEGEKVIYRHVPMAELYKEEEEKK